jgi:hypothetical protein
MIVTFWFLHCMAAIWEEHTATIFRVTLFFSGHHNFNNCHWDVKIMYIIFTGNSSRLPFQVMTNQTAVVASAHLLLGAQWGRTQEEKWTKIITVQNVTPCSVAERYHLVPGCCLHLLPWWWQKVSLEHWYLSARLHSVTPEGCDLH